MQTRTRAALLFAAIGAALAGVVAVLVVAAQPSTFLDGVADVAPPAISSDDQRLTLGVGMCELHHDQGLVPVALGVQAADTLRAGGLQITGGDGTAFAEYALEHCDELLGDPEIQARVREFRGGR